MDEQGKLTPGKNFLAGVGAGTRPTHPPSHPHISPPPPSPPAHSNRLVLLYPSPTHPPTSSPWHRHPPTSSPWHRRIHLRGHPGRNRQDQTHPPTHPPTHTLQHLIRTASFSSLLLLPTHPPTHLSTGTIESIFVVTPVETVKTKLIHLNMEFVGGVKHIVAKEGFAGVYKGLGATIMKQGSNQGKKKKGMCPSHPPTHPPTHLLIEHTVTSFNPPTHSPTSPIQASASCTSTSTKTG